MRRSLAAIPGSSTSWISSGVTNLASRGNIWSASPARIRMTTLGCSVRPPTGSLPGSTITTRTIRRLPPGAYRRVGHRPPPARKSNGLVGMEVVHSRRAPDLDGKRAGLGSRTGARAMGHARSQAERMDLSAMTPQTALTQTAYCLANRGVEYLVYAPNAGTFWVDLSGGSGRDIRCRMDQSADGRNHSGRRRTRRQCQTPLLISPERLRIGAAPEEHRSDLDPWLVAAPWRGCRVPVK